MTPEEQKEAESYENLLPFEDPKHRGNSSVYHTGVKCCTEGCDNPAGTWWSPHWCFEHNAKRIHRITKQLGDTLIRFKETQK